MTPGLHRGIVVALLLHKHPKQIGMGGLHGVNRAPQNVTRTKQSSGGKADDDLLEPSTLELPVGSIRNYSFLNIAFSKTVI